MGKTEKNRVPLTDEIGFIQIADAKVLAAVARGEIDLNRVARWELASRGLGLDGKWVGFEAAREIHAGPREHEAETFEEFRKWIPEIGENLFRHFHLLKVEITVLGKDDEPVLFRWASPKVRS